MSTNITKFHRKARIFFKFAKWQNEREKNLNLRLKKIKIAHTYSFPLGCFSYWLLDLLHY